jgi:hypothetical protein
VASGDIEMVDDVAEEIAILHDGGGRAHVEREAKTALAFVAARLHADFHHAFADGGLVAELSDVADGIDQRVSWTQVSKLQGFKVPKFQGFKVSNVSDGPVTVFTIVIELTL